MARLSREKIIEIVTREFTAHNLSEEAIKKGIALGFEEYGYDIPEEYQSFSA